MKSRAYVIRGSALSLVHEANPHPGDGARRYIFLCIYVYRKVLSYIYKFAGYL